MDNPFLASAASPGNVVLDLDGVVFLGPEVIDGAATALARLRDDGWRILVATNNATRTRQTIADRIHRQTGLAMDLELVVTSSIAAMGLLGESDHPVLAVGEQGLLVTFAEAGIPTTDDPDAARAVVVALDRGFDYDRLARASRAIHLGARFIATNGDTTFPTPEGPVPGAGAIVAAVIAASGSVPVVAGKPHRPMIDAVTRRLGPGETWMIGDRAETDLAFASAAGWRSVLTLSGVTTDPASVPAEWRPDLVVRSLAELFDPQ